MKPDGLQFDSQPAARRATEKIDYLQEQADSMIFADNLLITDDLKAKIKGYTDAQGKRLDTRSEFEEPEQ